MRHFDFDAPFLATERLELWLPRPADLAPAHTVVSEPETGRYLGSHAHHEHAVRFMRGAGSWLLYGYGPLQFRLRGDPALIGNGGVFHTFRGLGEDFDDHPEAGWILGREHVGRGLAREAMKAVLAWFDALHGPRRIVCLIMPGNAPSLALAARLGFSPYRDAVLPDGEPVTLLERAPG